MWMSFEYDSGSQTFPAVPTLLRWQILVPKLLHFFKKVTTLFEKVTTFYLMILLKIKKLLYFPKSRANIEKPRAHRCGRAHQFGNPWFS